MTNAARKSRQINDVVVLTNEQVNQYQNDCLILQNRNGQVIDVIQMQDRNPANEEFKHDAIQRLRLFEVMFAQLRGIELDEDACMGLSDLLTETIELLKA